MTSRMEPEDGPDQKFEELLGAVREARSQLDKEWGEVDQLIRQSSGELDNTAQANARIAAKLQRVQEEIDNVPVEQVRKAITDAQAAQARLFTMKGQLEQMEARREVLGQSRQNLDGILKSLEELASADEASEEASLAQHSMARVIQVQEDERQRLARQIHDGPAQSLTNLILKAEICERLFDRDPSMAKEELASLREDATSTFNKIRGFISDLRPMILDDLGLLPALRRYVRTFQEEHGIQVELSTGVEGRELPNHIEVTIFRLIQEALSNAARHAQAANIRVSLNLQGDTVTARVRDDGRGFDVEGALAAAQERKTLGLVTMQERAMMLGGSVSFDSQPGRGTTVTIELPAD